MYTVVTYVENSQWLSRTAFEHFVVNCGPGFFSQALLRGVMML